MSGATNRSGMALRAYQIIGILLAGWVLGRLPQMLNDNQAERHRLLAAISRESTPAPDAPAAEDATTLATRVAAQVAAQVAQETVASLIAAGWGPRQTGGDTIIIREVAAQGAAARPQEAIVRIVTDQPQQAGLAGVRYEMPADSKTEATPAPPPPADQTNSAHAVATKGYAALSAGDRRRAVQLLETAIRMDPGAQQAENWRTDVRRLTKRWSVSAYTLSRGAGTGDALAASPVLGASQSGAMFTYTLDPLARRRISAIARITAATGLDGGIDSDTAEAAIGLRAQPFANIPVALDVERRIPLGYYGRKAWSARISGGMAGSGKLLGRDIQYESYAEAGLVGFTSPDFYGGLQTRAATPLLSTGRMSVDAGAGLWAAGQESFGQTISRLDVGPSMRIGMHPWAFSAQVDYRVRTAGNARPASGPALTIAGQF